MGTTIKLESGGVSLRAELNDSDSARDFEGCLPTEITLSRWGDEYYGNCDLRVKQSSDAREEMTVGELALWPPGQALCIFFGPTPASVGSEPRAASPVNPIGRLVDDTAPLKSMAGSIRMKVSLE